MMTRFRKLIAGLSSRSSDAPVIVDIPIEKILLGGEKGYAAKFYASRIGQPLRPSTPALEGPHLEFLRWIGDRDESIIFDKEFQATSYFVNARNCIRAFGSYFPYAVSSKDIEQCALRFVRNFRGQSTTDLPSTGHSPAQSLPLVSVVEGSDCFELRNGNHRFAFAAINGANTIRCSLDKNPRTTPIQDMIADVGWDDDARTLYQPLPYPEVKKYILLRDCDERLKRIRSFLETQLVGPYSSVVDLGAYYGFFASGLQSPEVKVTAVERDTTAIEIGRLTFGEVDFVWDDAFTHIEDGNRYEVVLCLSIIHHAITGREGRCLEEMVRLLDRATEKVLFLESGESHEEWFGEKLCGWDANAIEQYILSRSSFTSVYRLGRDRDSVGQFKGQFGRMLFAFVKDGVVD